LSPKLIGGSRLSDAGFTFGHTDLRAALVDAKEAIDAS